MWQDLVKKVAPVLGTALGGPFGGMATKWLAGKLLGDENAPQEAVEEAITNASPETMLQVKKLENEFKVLMKELGIKEEQLHQQDRADARDMAKATSIVPQIVLSVVYDVAFIIVLYFVFTVEHTWSEVQTNIIMFVLGILSSALLQVNNFWFGSSSGSKEKTAQLGKAVK